MAVGDRSSVRIDGTDIDVTEIDRPVWGTIVYRAVDDPGVLCLEQLVSVGPYKVDLNVARRLTGRQIRDYEAGRLDYDGLAAETGSRLNRASLVRAPQARVAAVDPVADRALDVVDELVGKGIRRWEGMQMFIRSDADETRFEFSDPDVPCLQLSTLTATMEDETATVIETIQHDDEWALQVRPDATHPAGESTPGFRRSVLDELPTGAITSVSTCRSPSGRLAELELLVDGRLVLLVAGETDEAPDGRIQFRRYDASVLVFTSRADAESVDWVPTTGP